MLLKWIIPDIPSEVTEKIRREAYLTNEIIIKQEMARARGIGSIGSDSTGLNPLTEGIELQPVSNSIRNRQATANAKTGEKTRAEKSETEVMV